MRRSYLSETGITEQFKDLLRQYRKDWQDLCLGKFSHSLYPLWIKARKIQVSFSCGDSVPDMAPVRSNFEYADVELPSFVPGFASGFSEGWWSSFGPTIELYAQNVILGTEEDKEFFTKRLFDYNENFFPAWVEQTWDYGGCTKYGDYDWVGNLKSLDKLFQKIKSPGYIEDLNLFRNDLLASVTKNRRVVNPTYMIDTEKICTCDKKENVQSDLEKVLGYTQSSPVYNDTFSFVKESLDKVKDGTIKVLSEAEGYCSGG